MIADRGIPDPGWSDQRLVDRCLEGDETAWGVVVDKYKNLVYHLILKYRPGDDEAADLFQSVWLDAYNDLPKLRKKGSFKSWLISLTNHKCYHWKKKWKRREKHETNEIDAETLGEEIGVEADFVEKLERDQLVREAVFSLSDRCREMVTLLFFKTPPMPYKEVAEKLGLATGSIGFIRGRCLDRLQKALKKLGL